MLRARPLCWASCVSVRLGGGTGTAPAARKRGERCGATSGVERRSLASEGYFHSVEVYFRLAKIASVPTLAASQLLAREPPKRPASKTTLSRGDA